MRYILGLFSLDVLLFALFAALRAFIDALLAACARGGSTTPSAYGDSSYEG